MKTLTCIIPAYNDEQTIGNVIVETLRVAKTLHIPLTILVINDASVDGTSTILSSLQKKHKNIRVITHKKNQGYGQTIKELYQAAQTPWLVSLPGDFQIHPSQIAKLWKQKGAADMIIGRRIHRHDSLNRRVQSSIYNLFLKILFRFSLHDANSVRLMKTSIMKHISIPSTSAFVDAQLAIEATRAGFLVKEIPIAHQARTKGTGSGGKLSIILPTIRDMISYALPHMHS